MYHVYIYSIVELEIKELVKELYFKYGDNYANDIEKGILNNIEFLATNALATKLESIIKTNRRTYVNARKIGYRGFYLIYTVTANKVFIENITNVIK